MRKIHLFTAFLFGLTVSSSAQNQWNTSRIKHEINKLPVNGTVLYVAAHPDDENTRLISWLANEKKFRTAYLSLTRGDGGQNLIGNELGVKLGIIRTHELMAARQIDGGEQFFTRAFDFGYSKSPQETFTKWDRDSVLSDMVYVIRMLKPDYIITRFPPDEYGTHGHHTASAILALEAYEAAADPQRFPEHFSKGVKPHNVKAIFYNASTWWNKDLPELASKNDSFYSFDVGGFNPLLGESYTEMAGRSRSMHKSQGFGSSQPAGEQIEYLKLMKTRNPLPKNLFNSPEFFYSDNTLTKAYTNSIQSIDNEDYKSLMTNLVILKKWFKNQSSHPLATHRSAQVDEIIKQSLGLKITLSAQNLKYGQGSELEAEFSILQRLGENVKIVRISPSLGIQSFKSTEIKPTSLETGKNTLIPITIQLAPDYFSQLPWIKNGLGENMFDNSWNDGGIYAGTDYDVSVAVVLNIYGEECSYTIPLNYIHVDPVKGERYDPVLVLPQLSLELPSSNLLFVNQKSKQLDLKIRTNSAFKGQLITQLSGPFSSSKTPKGGFDFQKDSLHQFTLNIELLKEGIPGQIEFRSTGTLRQVTDINYDHIGHLLHCEVPKMALNGVNLSASKKKIAYLQGAGDEVNQYLQLAGYTVNEITQDQLSLVGLKEYDVLILGIRSYNTLLFADEQQNALNEFVKNGGNVIVQYITSRRINREDDFTPYPMKIGRGRVTEEDAPMVFINPKESVLLTPHQLGPDDFKFWVQERGLYFAESYDPHFRPIFKSHDTGEEDIDGALVIADFGQGSFIYTGISFFRQLPAGVPGAYRLLGNLIDYEPSGTK